MVDGSSAMEVLENRSGADSRANPDDTTVKRPHLEDSRPINWDRVATSPNGRRAIQHLLDRLEGRERSLGLRQRRRRARDRACLAATLEAVVMDLFVAAKTAPSTWLAYPRRKGAYGGPSRYRNPQVTYKSVLAVVDFLLAEGLARGTRGSYRREEIAWEPGQIARSGSGYRSRLIATEALIDLLETEYGLSLAEVGHRAEREVIILKGARTRPRAPAPLLDYADTAETDRMRSRLRDINRRLAAADIRLSPEGLRLARAADLRPDLGARTLYRVFNNGSFRLGGRFYGGFWITLPKEIRRHLLIDGEPVVELDFKALHPRLCYALSGRPLPSDIDPYAIDDLPRPVVKKAFNQLLNAAPHMKLRADAETRARLPRGVSYRGVLRRVEQRHADIADWFRSGKGLALQNIDARITETLLGSLVMARKIAVLPVHDSFIVQRRHEYTLGETMMLAYRGTLNALTGQPSYPVIEGWSDETTRQEVARTLRKAERKQGDGQSRPR